MPINACLCGYCVLGFDSFHSSTGHAADDDDAFIDRYDCIGYGYDSDERTSDD